MRAGAERHDRPDLVAALRRSVPSGEPFVVGHRIRRQDGAIRWPHSAGHLFPGANGDPEVLRGLTFDVTERAVKRLAG